MADSRDADELYWVEPRERAIIPLDHFHISRSLDRTIRSDRFTVSCDKAFAQVVECCAARPETWINRDIEAAVNTLHEGGHAHSIEVWQAGDLVGGLYGVALGRAFFGESMFSLERDASKVALAWLVARLKAGHFTLLDCQIMTPHLATLGAVSVPGSDYAALLSTAIGSAGGADSAGSAGALDLPPPEFGALDDLLAASARGSWFAGREGHFAILDPDVVDRVLDHVERRGFAIHPSRKDPAPAIVGTLDIDLDEGAGQLLVFPWRGPLARLQAHDHVLPPRRLARAQGDVADNSVALVEDSKDGHPLGHRCNPGLPATRLG